MVLSENPRKIYVETKVPLISGLRCPRVSEITPRYGHADMKAVAQNAVNWRAA